MTLRKCTKIIAEFIIYSSTLNPEDLDKFINCAQDSGHELHLIIKKAQYLSHLNKPFSLIVCKDGLKLFNIIIL